ncbi:MAG: TRAP transporter large permease subunit [Candidatus Zeuxoniibacter abyssi]|nr:MAG: TRAP transporter large permease subunit [Candidatus Persebacteraceae bacterium AB1(2)]
MLYGLIAKRLTVNGLISSLLDTAKTAAMIAFVLFGAEVLKGFFSRSGLPIALSEWAMVADISPLTVLLLVLLAFVVLGCFMDSFSMILVVTPFFWPVLAAINGGEWVSADAAAFGMDIDGLKIWFGVLCLIVVELGLITPPVGLNVFVISAIDRSIPMRDIFRGVSPFLAVELVRIALILIFPALALWLPATLSG